MTLAELKAGRHLPGPHVHNEVLLTGTLTTRSPLHVGSGLQIAGTREERHRDRDPTEHETSNLNGVMLIPPANPQGAHAEDPARDAKTLWPLPGAAPFIPGTSLRGVLRSWVRGVLCAYPGAATDSGDPNVSAEDLEKVVQAHADPAERDEARAEQLRQNLDLLSGLFGCTWWRSKVEVDLARLANPAEAGPGLVRRLPRVAIDHELGTVSGGKLFQVEMVRPGVTFAFGVRARNVRGWELGLLLAALDAFNHDAFPLRVGGHTQQGYGELDCRVARAVVYGQIDGQGSGYFDDWVAGQGNPRHGVHDPAELDRTWVAAARAALAGLGGA